MSRNFPFNGRVIIVALSAAFLAAITPLSAIAADTDGDGLPDAFEVFYGLDPQSAEGDNGPTGDPDDDGRDKFPGKFPNIVEARIGTNPMNWDTDGDMMSDQYEFVAKLNPLDPSDAALDPDHDGRTNLQEYENSGYFYTHPFKEDTDGDGLCDGNTVVGSCTGIEGEGLDEFHKARLRLIREQPIGPIQVVGNASASGDIELLRDEPVQIAGNFDPADTYTVRLSDGKGGVYWLAATLSGATLEVDFGSGEDRYGKSIPACEYSLVVWSDADQSGGWLLESNEVNVTVHRFLYIHSGLHGPTMATDVAGDVVWRRAYTPFGDELLEADEITTGQDLVSLGFVGRQYDEQIGLYQLGARWYDPESGRFISPDPIQSSMNQYFYAANNPFRYQDRDGLDYNICIPQTVERPEPTPIFVKTNTFLKKHTRSSLERAGSCYLDFPQTCEPYEPLGWILLDSLVPDTDEELTNDVMIGVLSLGTSLAFRMESKALIGGSKILVEIADESSDLNKSLRAIDDVSKVVKNPYGRPGGPLHRLRISVIEDKLRKYGWETLSGGENLPEKLVKMSWRNRGRFPDLVMEKDARKIAIQVGTLDDYGLIPDRELDAIDDLILSGEFYHVYFFEH